MQPARPRRQGQGRWWHPVALNLTVSVRTLARALKSPVFGASDEDLAALALRAREARALQDIGEDGRPLRGPAPAWLDLLLQGGWTQPRLAEAAAQADLRQELGTPERQLLVRDVAFGQGPLIDLSTLGKP